MNKIISTSPPQPNQANKQTNKQKLFQTYLTAKIEISSSKELRISIAQGMGVTGSEVQIEERLGVEAVAAVIMNFDSNGIEDYDELIDALDRCEYWPKPKKH